MHVLYFRLDFSNLYARLNFIEVALKCVFSGVSGAVIFDPNAEIVFYGFSRSGFLGAVVKRNSESINKTVF